jgi:adenine-specific DNA-methyltransferase
MQKLTASDPETQSADVIAENLAALRELFPELITEGADGVAVNVDVLKALVGDKTVTDAEEKYGLNWHGKRRARQLALTPSTGTLRPCPEDSVDWDTTQNLMIEGDNLEVLKLLQKSYAGKVKLIYIDPPYNTGRDFVYPDNFQDNIKNYLELTGQTGDGGKKLSSNTEASGRFHTDWINMMYPRLKLARNLLREDGVIFVSIDDGELPNIQALLNELFGEENFQACISWQKRYTRSNNTVDFTAMIEHIIVYSRNEMFAVNLLDRTEEADARYSNPDNDERGPWKGASFLNPATPDQRPNLCYPIKNPNTGSVTNPSTNAWRRSEEEFFKLASENRLYWGRDGTALVPSIKMFLSEARNITPVNFWDHEFAGNTDAGTRDLKLLFDVKVFDNPKPIQLIKRVLEHASQSDSLVLDFFAGSGTTGHAVMAMNAADSGQRKFILVQLPEMLDRKRPDQKPAAEFCVANNLPCTLSEVTKERLRRAGKKIQTKNRLFAGDHGFRVFKLDSTNIREWEPDRDKIAETLEASIEHLKTDRTEQDILFELLLKLGLDLCVPIETRKVKGSATQDHDIHCIGGGSLLVCLSKSIPQVDVEPLALALVAWHQES